MRFKLKEERERKHISQEMLAELSGVSRATISKLENNAVDVCSSNTLVKLADALNVNVSALFME